MLLEDVNVQESLSEHTFKEIGHQPALWRMIYDKVLDEKESISSFLEELGSDYTIVLTGAGTSAYIGLSVQNVFRQGLNVITEPIASTHIVSHPHNYFLPSRKILMVSFARSGNSPESCAAVDLADQICNKVHHLIITCNDNGKLAIDNRPKENAYVFTLPEEANDKSLVMTSSFSGMMLASILIARIANISELKPQIDKLVDYGEQALEQRSLLWSIAAKEYSRAIFLGSGSLYGVAKEAQLKMQELTDGLIISKHDSFLGLRHGPRAVINDQTLVVYHLSNNKYANKYDYDLVKSMRVSSNPCAVLALGEDIDDMQNVDFVLNFNSQGSPVDEDFMPVVSIVPAQLLGLYKSLQLGLTPDNPSRNGAISRVVQGVNIYESK